MKVVLVRLKHQPKDIGFSNKYLACLCPIESIKKFDMVVVARKKTNRFEIGIVVDLDESGIKYVAHDYVVSTMRTKASVINERLLRLEKLSEGYYIKVTQNKNNYYGVKKIKHYADSIMDKEYLEGKNYAYNKIKEAILCSKLNDLNKYGLIALIDKTKNKKIYEDENELTIILNSIKLIKHLVDEKTYNSFVHYINSLYVKRPPTEEEIRAMDEQRKSDKAKKLEKKKMMKSKKSKKKKKNKASKKVKVDEKQPELEKAQ